MANIGSWVDSLKTLNSYAHRQVMTTTETYSEIKKMGLETVNWKTYSSTQLLISLEEVKTFIEENHPCLFIFDPLSAGSKKGFLFDVRNFDAVKNWIESNKSKIQNYTYLITTQIYNPGDGFVGSVFSDGKGKLFCETLHIPGICNHRELSQPTRHPEEVIKYRCELFIDSEEESTSWAVSNNNLSRQDILLIEKLYLNRTGYFEFVKGQQGSRKGIFTVGYEVGGLFRFPDSLHHTGCTNMSNRILGKHLRDT